MQINGKIFQGENLKNTKIFFALTQSFDYHNNLIEILKQTSI